MHDQPAPTVRVEIVPGRTWDGVLVGETDGFLLVQVAPHMQVITTPDRVEKLDG